MIAEAGGKAEVKPADLMKASAVEKTVAAIAKLTPTQLERRMRRVFQLSTTQFVRKSRIENAARLLRDTRMAIAEVALECGYGDQTALTRQFRSTVGMPPAAYRDHVKKRPVP